MYQPESFTPVLRMFVILWCLPLRILLEVYKGSLQSMLTVPLQMYSIQSINELPNRPEISVYVWKGSAIDELMVVSYNNHRRNAIYTMIYISFSILRVKQMVRSKWLESSWGLAQSKGCRKEKPTASWNWFTAIEFSLSYDAYNVLYFNVEYCS